MVKIEEKTTRELSGPDEIAAHLAGRYAALDADRALRPGDPVEIVSRNGMTPDMAVGNVGVLMSALPGQPWCHILTLNAVGAEMTVQVPRDNLTKRNATPAQPAP
ncbi:hypothetical protein [Methylobacterium gossipiicola]|uniref:DUF4926 domain-containing protein n=1 Tax=Methylobacterium gossipiicola TaxID=582675 RepID=A0A1I2XMQ5_9HYPH|nr:hypothetical protein [Methylobacterium gossipiicola]SFH14798.1 hypothetical protein SAMN05192565_1541 [Methylobacterium gossipiicola]